jgi:glucokinase
VGAAGQIHSGTGVVQMGPNLGWRQVPFASMLAARLPQNVLLMNDLSAAAWGERCVGAGEGLPDVLLVFVGSGVGSGIIAKGELYEGASGVAGELGHTKVVPDGRRCGCGERGCLEAYCGGHNLSAQVAEAVAAGRSTTLSTAGGRSVGAAEIETAALAGDALAKELWDNCQQLLSTAIANYATVLNPSRVVLGGGVLLGSPELKKAVGRTAMALISASARESVQIVDARLGDDAGVVGAGLRALAVAADRREQVVP